MFAALKNLWNRLTGKPYYENYKKKRDREYAEWELRERAAEAEIQRQLARNAREIRKRIQDEFNARK